MVEELPLFSTIVVGVARSPRAEAILREAAKLAEEWRSRLIVVHAATGDKAQAQAVIEGFVQRALPSSASVDVVVSLGVRPSDEIMRVAAERRADLILAGALEHESVINRIVGSAARRMARKAPCSVLLLPAPKKEASPFRNIVVGVDPSDEAEIALSVAVHLARREHAEKLVAVWEYVVPGLNLALGGSSPADEMAEHKKEFQDEEEARLASLLQTADLHNLRVEAVCRYGESRWVANEYARTHDADLLVIPAPIGRTGLFYRMFGHHAEHVLRDLPCAVLFVRRPLLA